MRSCESSCPDTDELHKYHELHFFSENIWIVFLALMRSLSLLDRVRIVSRVDAYTTFKPTLLSAARSALLSAESIFEKSAQNCARQLSATHPQLLKELNLDIFPLSIGKWQILDNHFLNTLHSLEISPVEGVKCVFERIKRSTLPYYICQARPLPIDDLPIDHLFAANSELLEIARMREIRLQ